MISKRSLLSPAIFGILGAAFAGCSPCDKSIALIFPNQEAHMATQRIRVEAHNPDSGGATSGTKDCGQFLGMAKQGKEPPGSPRQQDFKFPFSQSETLNNVPSGRQIIYVLAFASSDMGSPAILEGCTDKFDSTDNGKCSDVAVELKTVLPDNARLVKVAGDRQVGRPGEHLAVPLTVRVDAESPLTSATYSVPGVPVTFSSKDPGFAITGAMGTDLAIATDGTGQAKADVMLPPMPKTGDILATAPDLVDPMHPERGKQTFSLSVTEEVSFPHSSLIGGSDIPIAAALGHVTSPSSTDLVVLTCQGSVQTCVPGGSARTPFGKTKLSVYSNLSAQPSFINVTMPPGGFGILPAGLAVADFVPPMGQDDIAVLNSRRDTCQDRVCQKGKDCACYGKPPDTPCPCEGSEVLVLTMQGGSIVLDHTRTLTASNAVGMTAIRSVGGRYFDLGIAAQGRTTNFRPCSTVNRCLPYDTAPCRQHPERCSCTDQNVCTPGGVVCANGPNCDCLETPDGGTLDAGPDPCIERLNPELYGCPPGERCECSGCPATQQTGVCVARDKIVDILGNRWNSTPGTAQPCSVAAPTGTCPGQDQVCQSGVCVRKSFYNRGGCNHPVVSCDNSSARTDASCTCLDDYNGNQCLSTDGCGCKVPDRVYIGDVDAPTLPFAINAGALRSDVDWDVIVPALSGLELIEAHPVQRTYAWKGEPIMNAPIDQSIIADFDSNDDHALDVAWIAGSPCLTGTNFQSSCATFRDLPMGTDAKGCVGILYTDKQASVFDLRPPMMGGCRRFFMPFAPDGICSGDFNKDGFQDVAISSRESNMVYVMNGDGRGGLLDPPKTFPLPGNGAGGPMVCGDIDGDGKDDIIVVNAVSGEIYLFRTGN